MTKNHTIINQNKTVQYDDFADTFGKSRRDLHWAEIDGVISDFLVQIQSKNGSIADIGCGNGRFLKHMLAHEKSDFIQQHFSTYVGLDVSRVLLDQARVDHTLFDFFALTEWIEGDMRDMGGKIQKYGSFVGIFFIASFHHLMTRAERVSVLSQAKNLLSENGKIVMINWHLLADSQEKYQSSKIQNYPDGSADFDIKIGTHKRFYHAFSHEEYLSLADETGLTVSDSFGERNSIVFWS